MAKIAESEVRSRSSTTMPPALPQDKPTLFAHIVARPNAGRDDDHVHVQRPAVGKLQTLDRAMAVNFLRRHAEMDLDPHRFDALDQSLRTGLIDLPRHKARAELDDMGFQPQFVRSSGGL